MKRGINWDAIGISASLACAIHCAVLPLFLSALPLFGINIIHNIGFEIGMIVLALCIGLYSLSHGFKKHHHNNLPIILFTTGIGFLILKQVFHEYELILLLLGVPLIVIAHVLNIKFCRINTPKHNSNCNH